MLTIDKLRRKLNPKKFAQEFPSVLWQEDRLQKQRTDELFSQRQLEKAASLASHEQQLENQAKIVLEQKLEAFRNKEQKKRNEIDVKAIEAIEIGIDRLGRLKHFEIDRLETLKRTQLEQKRLDDQITRENEIALAEKKEIEDKFENERKLAEEQDLIDRVNSIMRRTGIMKSVTNKQKEYSEISKTIAMIRFACCNDDQDAKLRAFNVWPMAQYTKRFPTAKDYNRQFSHLFNPIVQTVKGQTLQVAGGAALGKCLAGGGFPQMVKLDLCWNRLKFFGIRGLCEGLPKCKVLTSLILSGNLLGDDSIDVLKSALLGNSTLIYLDLENNDIADKGAASVARVIFSGVPLQVVKLKSNRITSAGAGSLAKAGIASVSIKVIAIKNNPVPPRDAKRICKHSPFISI